MIGCKKKLADSQTYSFRLSLLSPNKSLSITRQSELLSISKSSLYYEEEVTEYTLEIMHKIDKIYTEHHYYWTRRISKTLQQSWYNVWRKKARTLMRKMWLEAQYPKPNTSKSNPDHKIYPYLLRGYKFTEANEIRSIDITYIRMPKWWLYLVAVIDWYSRKILSRRLSPTLELDFCVDCLKEAINKYGTPKIFNTDQWSQFTSNEFTWVLLDKWMQISMDWRGRATDNIYIERFRRSLKQEEVYISEYNTPIEAQTWIRAYINKYNSSRIHQSIGYNTPNEHYQKSIEKQKIHNS